MPIPGLDLVEGSKVPVCNLVEPKGNSYGVVSVLLHEKTK